MAMSFAVHAQVPRAGTTTLPISAADFLANPSSLLRRFPEGGALMVSEVRGLVVADITTLGPIVALVPNANDLQKSAIGTALGQVALMYATTNPQAATQIQEAIAKIADASITAAYTVVTGDTATAATGGGGGAGSAGAGGSQTGTLALGASGSSGTASALLGPATTNPGFSFTPISVSGASTSPGSTTTTTTIINSVSPTTP